MGLGGVGDWEGMGDFFGGGELSDKRIFIKAILLKMNRDKKIKIS